ncbi:ArsR/SmtB family transcription factor [Collimonas silvisoli]|uniref:ArsR/SmtB family transcription factor n=1 Tax=Collimonas silvisoli TaxID=2825884 RepID=UPI001B8D08AE|nr:metalloregulator ArsR/SmtB family transcription factor [Collimonas silvisoli]
MSQTPPQENLDNLDQVFMALADPTRRQLVRMLAEHDCTVSQLAQPFDMSLAAVSKHIKVLEAAGVVARRVDGRVHTLTLRPESLTGALDWITIYRNFWQRRLAALDDLFSTGGSPEP